MGELYDRAMIEWLQQAVEASLGAWGLPADARVALLTVSENATFQVTDSTGQVRCVVRVHRPAYHTRAEIDSELSWIESLRSDQVVVTPEPLPVLTGGHLVSFNDGDDTRLLAAFEFMRGREPSPADSLVRGFRQLGAINARLHQHAQHWQQPAHFVRKTWNFRTTIGDTPHWGAWQDSAGLTGSDRNTLAETVELIRRRVEGFGESAERFGLIHADLRLANLLVDGDTLAVIDFDDCGFGWYLYDFATAVSFIEEDPRVDDMLQAWLAGYREIAPLNTEDAGMIPTFIMLRRLMLTGWLSEHGETPTAQELGQGFLEGTVRMAERMLQTGSPLNAGPAAR